MDTLVVKVLHFLSKMSCTQIYWKYYILKQVIKKYLDFGLRLYKECPNLKNFMHEPEDGANFQRCYINGHGATVVEVMRIPYWFWEATGNQEFLRLGLGVVNAMNHWIMPSGALVSQESVDSRPQPWKVGYEYCTILERELTLLNAGQKLGDAANFQAAEQLWFNAAQGSREPDGSAVTYCSCENRLSIHDEIGRRQRFSPTHQQTAVCCSILMLHALHLTLFPMPG